MPLKGDLINFKIFFVFKIIHDHYISSVIKNIEAVSN